MIKNDLLPFLLIKFWKYFSPKSKSNLIRYFFVILISSFTEIISVSLVIPLLGILSNEDYLLQNIYIKKFSEFFNFTNQNQIILSLFFIFIFLIIFSGLVKTFYYRMNYFLSAEIGSELSTKIFSSILNQEYFFHINKNTSKILSSLVTDIGRIIGKILMPSFTLLSSLIVLIGLITATILINPYIVVSFGFFISLFYFSLFQISKSKLTKESLRQVELDQKLFKILQEGLGSIRDVLNNNNQEMYSKFYSQIDCSYRNSNASTAFLGVMPKLIIEPFSIILLFLVGYFLIKSSGFESAIPIIGAFALIFQKALPLMQSIYQSITQIKTGKDSLKNILYLLSLPRTNLSSKRLSPLRFSKNITIKKLSFTYNYESPLILNEINLDIKKGEKIGIIGSTGSGKSTLLDILIGLLPPTSGDLLIDGKNIYNRSSKQILYRWRKNVACVPQNIYLTDASIAENIAFGISKEKINFKKVALAAKKAELLSFVEKCPEGFETFVGERGVKLSGGQKQRIGIARALYKTSQLLILDESTNALDVNTEKSVINTINQLSPEITIIMISHRYESLNTCDRILRLKRGKIIELDSELIK